MEDLTLFENYPIIQLISYIITVIIGGVGFKYYQLYTNNKTDTNQHLVQNLSDRVEKLTNDLEKFEKERKEIHERELERAEQLAEARAEVRILTERVKHLEKTLNRVTEENQKFKEKYGDL